MYSRLYLFLRFRLVPVMSLFLDVSFGVEVGLSQAGQIML